MIWSSAHALRHGLAELRTARHLDRQQLLHDDCLSRRLAGSLADHRGELGVWDRRDLGPGRRGGDEADPDEASVLGEPEEVRDVAGRGVGSDRRDEHGLGDPPLSFGEHLLPKDLVEEERGRAPRLDAIAEEPEASVVELDQEPVVVWSSLGRNDRQVDVYDPGRALDGRPHAGYERDDPGLRLPATGTRLRSATDEGKGDREQRGAHGRVHEHGWIVASIPGLVLVGVVGAAYHPVMDTPRTIAGSSAPKPGASATRAWTARGTTTALGSALSYVKLALLALGCVFGLYIGVRDLSVALAEDEPTVFEAATFAERYHEQQWIEVSGRVALEHGIVEPSDNRVHAGRGLSYVSAPVVAPDWDPTQPVHVLATFGPFTREGAAAWSRDIASVERVRGRIRPVPLGDGPERFAPLELGTPLVVINEGTEPSLGAALLFSGFMLVFGGLAGYALLLALRDVWRRPPAARG